MKYACAKCNHILTKDLYLTTKIDRENFKDEDGDVMFSTAEVKPGTFVLYRYITFRSTTNRKNRKWAARVEKHEGTKSLTYIFNSRRNRQYTDRFISVNRNDATGCFMYPFQQGYGCCDNHHIRIECGGCYEHIGWENYDCYETLKHIQFLDNKVVRDFSGRPTIEPPKATHMTFADGVEMDEHTAQRHANMALKAFNTGKSVPFVDPLEGFICVGTL
jgi:hypothetical protein